MVAHAVALEIQEARSHGDLSENAEYTEAKNEEARINGRILDIEQILQQNDAYHALQAVGGLLITGPTGTNVNDVAVALLEG